MTRCKAPVKAMIIEMIITYRGSVVGADLPVADPAGEGAHHAGVRVDGHRAVLARLVVRAHRAHDHEQQRRVRLHHAERWLQQTKRNMGNSTTITSF